ncbi:MAG: YmdB family metallophosphoesterase, partial [Patescibacteria group bacterium]
HRTDVGMVGPHYSSIGLQAEPIIKNLLTQIPSHPKPDVAPGPVEINAVLLDFGKKGKVEKFERLRKIVNI